MRGKRGRIPKRQRQSGEGSIALNDSGQGRKIPIRLMRLKHVYFGELQVSLRVHLMPCDAGEDEPENAIHQGPMVATAAER